MVGSRGKGTRSKTKGLAPCDSLKVSFDEPANDLLDGGEEGNDSLNREVILLEEEQMDEINSGSAIGDEQEEMEQNAVEGSNMEAEINEINVDETETVCAQGGAQDETKEEGDGGAATNVSAEDVEERANEEKPKDDSDACTVVERKVLPTNDDGLTPSDIGMLDNMTENLEISKDPSEVQTEDPMRTLVNMEEDITNEVKEATGLISRPKKKVVKKKLVKKKLLRKKGATLHEGTPVPSGGNNAIVEAGKVDTNEDMNNYAADEADARDFVNNEKKAGGISPVKVSQKGSRIEKKMGTQGHSGAVIAKDDQTLLQKNNEPNEFLDDEEKEEVNPPVKVNKKRSRIKKKKAPQGLAGAVTAKDDKRLPSRNGEPGSKDHNDTTEPDVKIGGVEKAGDRMISSNKSKDKKVENKGSVEVISEDKKNSKPSNEGKPKRINSMGMIFMCSSETKDDCYQYKVLGLPASKKDMVLKIYKGMRIFLFDVDLRMMYGIYKAAGPGGYNIEPEAFKSQYPSQVRFSILEDCVPLAEERFRTVLKDNYFTKNKFDCQLSSVQVKNLCKLFHESNKKAGPAKVNGKNRRAAATTSSAQRDKKRKRVEDNRRGATSYLEKDRSRRRAQEDLRHTPVVIDDRYRGRPVYKRETYVPSVAPVPIYQPVTAISPRRSYSYDRSVGADPYRRERDVVLGRDSYRREIPALDRDSYRRQIPVGESDAYRTPVLDHDLYRRESVLDHRDLGPSSSRESRIPVERSHHEPYASYREVREPRFYSGPAYSTDTKREHYDYTSSGRYAEHYRLAEDRPAPPLYRRY